MKKLLQLVVLLACLTMITESYAQTFGVKAGLNLSKLNISDNDGDYSDQLDMLPGFHIGGTVEFPTSEWLSFETGLLLSTKGNKFTYTQNFNGETIDFTNKLNLFYLDIPMSAKAFIDLGGAKIYGAFGPYIGFGLSGKNKSEVKSSTGDSNSSEEDVNWGSDANNDDLKRLDFGLNMGAGVVIKSIEIGVSYGLGLANTSTFTDNGTKYKNRVLGISLGYKFGVN